MAATCGKGDAMGRPRLTIQILHFPVTLVTSVNLSESQFPHLVSEDCHSIIFQGYGGHKIRQVDLRAKHLGYNKCLINGSSHGYAKSFKCVHFEKVLL